MRLVFLDAKARCLLGHKLTFNVAQMVLTLVESVRGQPGQGASGRLWIVVNAFPVPGLVAEAPEHKCDHRGASLQLTDHLNRVLFGVSSKRDSLIPVDRGERRTVLDQRQKKALPLGEEDIADVTRILQWRPHSLGAALDQ